MSKVHYFSAAPLSLSPNPLKSVVTRESRLFVAPQYGNGFALVLYLEEAPTQQTLELLAASTDLGLVVKAGAKQLAARRSPVLA
jgi:hypothetical protein